ncbi:Hypothetical protein SMAX5B_001381 [Scophthalmus maximus]|uniref:Uncharacterized protein n=1 Tax=Scophthalmus maximus TaxID=52904 RepID=A0A2U9CP42_SCOMX|nr:Hypothetical protein SMAX5B_001381 [Scophthalmus maximus]
MSVGLRSAQQEAENSCEGQGGQVIRGGADYCTLLEVLLGMDVAVVRMQRMGESLYTHADPYSLSIEPYQKLGKLSHINVMCNNLLT